MITTYIYIHIHIYIPKSPCLFSISVRALQSSNELSRSPWPFENTAPVDKSVLQEPAGCLLVLLGAPGYRNHQNRSKTLHLLPNPRKRFSAVTSWRSKTLHLSTNARKRLSGVTGRSNRLLRSHWALESAALGPRGARNHSCREFEINIICAQF